MANFVQPGEKFVKVPGIIEITWRSDDPDFYQKPTDLFDEQAKGKGLSDFDGKKNKLTLEQVFFTCMICECECKSVVTLRAHCKGAQHIRKALTKQKEYFDARKAISTKSEGNNKENYRSHGIKSEGNNSGKYRSHGKFKKAESYGSATYKREDKENKNWIKSDSCVFKKEYDNVKKVKRDRDEAKVDERGGKCRKNDEGGSEERYESLQVYGEKVEKQGYLNKISTTKVSEVKKLHHKVADCVMKRLDTYLVGLESTKPRNRKLRKSEYSELAKKFSHDLRSKIKDGYQSFHGSLDGIKFTLDYQEQINTEIDMYFDSIPVIKFDD